MRKNTQRQQSKARCLLRKMMIDTSTALRLPRKMKVIFWKRCRSIVPVTQCSYKITVSLSEFSSWTPKFVTSISVFRARLPSIFITCHKLRRLPSNLHAVTTWCSPDIAIRKKRATRHVQSAAPARFHEDGRVQTAAPASKNRKHLVKTMQKYCACHTERLLTRYEICSNVTKHHACHTTSKVTAFAALPI